MNDAADVAEAETRRRMIAAMVRDFAEREVRPHAGALDESEAFPEEIYRKMAAHGLFGITVPETLGGAGADVSAYALVMEELARGYASVADQCGLVELVASRGAAPTRSPSPRRDRTSRASARRRRETATAGGFRVKRSGSTTRRSRTLPSCSHARIRRQAGAG
jgi:alkylation response protein AidB-like acyl-CoA dehydrogenase